MLYRLYLYRSSAAIGSAPSIGIVNAAISENSERGWERNNAADYMEPFDTKSIIHCIEEELTDPLTGQCKCRPIEKYPPKQNDGKGYIFVATSYAKAAQVLPRLHAIAVENDLTLYDAETNRSFFRDLIDTTYITMRNRQQELHQAILKAMKPIWKIRRIEIFSGERDKACSYAVTIRKAAQISFEQRNEQFYSCLKANLRVGEKLVCEHQCYTVVGEWYTITYVLEGYKRHPDRIGYVEEGVPRVALMNRMGVDAALCWMKNCTQTEQKDIHARMLFCEMQEKYPNPAQRLAESVKITKWQRKQVFDIRYSGIGYYESEILFHVVPDSFYQNFQNISVLKIEEESASFILPFINDVYPDFYARYYLDENHLSVQMWVRILDRLKEAKEMILHDTFNEKLKPYIDKFNLFVLTDHEKPNYWETVNSIDNTRFLYEHRYQVAYLYDVFIQWSEAQMKAHNYCGDLMFNIQGP